MKRSTIKDWIKISALFSIVILLSCQPSKEYYIEDNVASIGAPPLIKHEIDGYEDCLDCHTDDGDEDATQTSHAERVNCQQCHIPENLEIEAEFKNVFNTSFRLSDEMKKTLEEIKAQQEAMETDEGSEEEEAEEEVN